jgi:hypothetical protein
MRALPARFSRRGSAITLAVALALTVGADVAIAAGGADGVAGIGGHGTSLAAERQYLKTLRPVATRIYAAVSPAQNIIDQIAEPHAGDAFSARDALAHGDALGKLRSARRALSRLDAPGPLAVQQRQMVAGTDAMIKALASMHGLAKNTNSTHLLAVINGVGSTRMPDAEMKYDRALRAAFRTGHWQAPNDFRARHLHAPVSQTGWIFGADRTCNAAALNLTDVIKYRNPQTLSDAESAGRVWMRALGKAGRKLTSLARPHGASALPRALRDRLHLVTYTSRLFAHELSGVRAQSISEMNRAVDQIRGSEPSMRVLGRALKSYGAVSCGAIVAVWGGKHVATTSNHGHHALNA